MPIQVKSEELRAAALGLRQDAAENLRQAAGQMRAPERRFAVEDAFDTYTTAAAYREYATAMEQEFKLLEEATRQLADALVRTADEYDAVDERSAQRVDGAR